MVDSGGGALSFPGGIIFHGGEGNDSLTLNGGEITAIATAVDGAQTTLTITDHASKADQVIRYDGVEAVNNYLGQASDLTKIGDGLQDFFHWLDRIADAGQGLEQKLAVFGGSLLRAVAGLPMEESPGDDYETGGFRRLLETDEGEFILDGIGAGIDTLDQLREALDALDEFAGNVSFLTIDDTTTFTARIVKRLGGQAGLEVAFEKDGGSVNLTGRLDVEARLEVNLVFGFDADGFFIDTLGAEPEIVINDVDLSARPGRQAASAFSM